jgi:peptidoglycan/LPS O-acetylase OafA/YrhL
MVFIDGLRGLAALSIVLVHSEPIFHATTLRNDRLADLLYTLRHYSLESVQVFFVLSGFVIAYTLRNATLTPLTFGRFFLRRVIRLDPPYWVSIALSSLTLYILAVAHHHPATFPSPGLVLAHLFYLQDLLGYGEPINHIYWTLCVEIQMYLFFALMICVLQSLRLQYRSILTLGLIVSLGWPLGWFHLPPVRTFLPQEYCFLSGAVAWWTLEKSLPRWLIFAAAGAFLAVSICPVGDYHLWVVFALAILLVFAGMCGTLYTWLGSPMLQFLGSVSYGLYLLHDPVIQLSLLAQRQLHFTYPAGEFTTLTLVYAISIAVAYALRQGVELPSIRFSHRLKRPV